MQKSQDPLERDAVRPEGSPQSACGEPTKPAAIVILGYCRPAIFNKSGAINYNKPHQITTFE